MKKPGRYIQQKGLINKVGEYCNECQKLLILLGGFNSKLFIEKIRPSLTISHEFLVYEKESTKANILTIVNKMRNENFDGIMAVGGGKIIDIAKAVCFYHDSYLIVMPTAASMDGACSAISVLYQEDGKMDRYLYLEKNPDIVLADSEIIFAAPFKLICAGMADALATYFETKNYARYNEVEPEVMQMSYACLYNIIDNYDDVKKAYTRNQINEEVEKVIETILYDSGVAFENSSTSVAHAFANASTKLKNSVGMHGERVALGLRLQLLLEENDWVKDLDHFLKALQLPMHLSDLHIEEKVFDELIEGMLKEEGMKYAEHELNKEELKEYIEIIK